MRLLIYHQAMWNSDCRIKAGVQNISTNFEVGLYRESKVSKQQRFENLMDFCWWWWLSHRGYSWLIWLMTYNIWNSVDGSVLFLVLYYLVNSDGVDGALSAGTSHRRPLKVTPLTLTAATAGLKPAHYSYTKLKMAHCCYSYLRIKSDHTNPEQICKRRRRTDPKKVRLIK